jgi:hypothetical protein
MTSTTVCASRITDEVDAAIDAAKEARRSVQRRARGRQRLDLEEVTAYVLRSPQTQAPISGWASPTHERAVAEQVRLGLTNPQSGNAS